MPPRERAAHDARNYAAKIVRLCEEQLEPAGFIDRAHTTLWRRTNNKFDVLKINIIPKARSEKWRVPIGSFSLDPSCLFPYLPRSGYRASDKKLHPEAGFGQVRLWLHRGIVQPAVKPPNIWWAGHNAIMFELVATDVHRKIEEEVLPFFSRFEDPQELLRTLLEEEDGIGRGGPWEFGKKGSPRRLLYTGFAALECSKWELAISSLRECKAKIITIGGSVEAELSSYIDQGIACAENRRMWCIV